MPSKVKVSGAWHDVKRKYVKAGGQWHSVKERYVKVGGVWRKVGDFFHVTPYIVGSQNFIGTYRAGVMDDGSFGASFTGNMGNTGNTVYIGIEIPGITVWGPVSFTLDYTSSDPYNTTLYAATGDGNSQATWSNPVSNHVVSWPYWSSDVMRLYFYVSSQQPMTAQFTIKNLNINGVSV